MPGDGKAIQSGTKCGTADDRAAPEGKFGQVLALDPTDKKPHYAARANEMRQMRERHGKPHPEMGGAFRQ
ncbi:hypothetical protein J2R62_19240 [Plesiomonas shigelloides]|uniref:Uncharacterized protein n=1 Tax=Plesiomonas shigelloides TaxID=703 RepID=A0A8I1W9B5_PLESH|nr:hypothetical protein [Plesiomonas shigelloides]MBO1110237.1 hypothetical protein [Plesiomonas shigelloides]